MRDLSVAEIIGQVWLANKSFGVPKNKGHRFITNVVMMGMGEPLSNRKAVHPSLTILNEGYGVGARRITVSTVGVVPGIQRQNLELSVLVRQSLKLFRKERFTVRIYSARFASCLFIMPQIGTADV